MFGSPEVSYHQTYSARDWLSILRTLYPTQNLQRKHRTDSQMTTEIIPLQTTRKENNWNTEEALARAAVNLETERIEESNPWCLWWWWWWLKKFKIYIQTLKTLLHVWIIRSSSGSTYCSLLKLYIKTIIDVLRYLNLVMWLCKYIYIYIYITLLRNNMCSLRMIVWSKCCRRVLSVLMQILDFFNIISKCISWCLLVCSN